MDIVLGKKQTPEFNLPLGEELVLHLTKDLERLFCTVYFDKLIENFFQKYIYGIGTVPAKRKLKMKVKNTKNDRQ